MRIGGGNLRELTHLRYRVALPRRAFLSIGAAGGFLVIAVFLFVVWTFFQYQLERFREDVVSEEIVPRLKRDTLEHFVRRVRDAGVPSPTVPSGSETSPVGERPLGGRSPQASPPIRPAI